MKPPDLLAHRACRRAWRLPDGAHGNGGVHADQQRAVQTGGLHRSALRCQMAKCSCNSISVKLTGRPSGCIGAPSPSVAAVVLGYRQHQPPRAPADKNGHHPSAAPVGRYPGVRGLRDQQNTTSKSRRIILSLCEWPGQVNSQPVLFILLYHEHSNITKLVCIGRRAFAQRYDPLVRKLNGLRGW
jgi:hypothetical protein